ncbi:Peptidase M15A, C-terminal [uncultured Caudovirales phage]|uniref:Peptidase M15A, C-terminal n=1 Tax=uncultured Caudovirales phage TaxID=2100421 RepID=A0A6J5RS95_9CAUD|nr:Peptidase M15A, C-terminal [uncultured Caudovirales phage]CAB4200170.1 Peptidase M15A, C-terminal [uncultured Caudovirales phage]
MTPHFTLAELTATSHRQFDNTPNEEETANLQRLAEFLERVKEALDGKPIMINSAFRSKQVNDSVGSKDTSQHRTGCAADFKVPGMTPDAVVRAIMAAGLPFDQIIREFDAWTHVSISDKPRRQALIIDRAGTRPFA